MAPTMIRMALGLLWLCTHSITLAKPTNIQPRQFTNVPGDVPFTGFDGCFDEANGNPMIKDIEQAWADVVTLVNTPRDFFPPQTLEKRLFGDNIGQRFNDMSLIHTIFNNLQELDGSGRKIRIACKDIYQDFRSKELQVTCKNVITSSSGSIGAYAFAPSGSYEESTIVLCSPFFAPGQETLGQRVQYLRTASRDDKKNPNLMTGKFRTLLHELIHLPAIEGTEDTIVIDQLFNTESYQKIYGIFWVERFARNRRGREFTHLNADNYAWYGCLKYFERMFGTPNPSYQKRDEDDVPEEPSILENKNLRILPLGDSITFGFKSSDGNGYRKALRDILTGAGNKVDMIGSVKAGSMEDNDNEGHSGLKILEIAGFDSAYKQRPNVVLLHAGTNDMGKASDADGAPQRLDDLVGTLVKTLPDASILVARIIPAASSDTMSRIKAYNEAITTLMTTRAKRGEHVLMVDMPSSVSTSDLSDGLHPNDQGYQNMANKWVIGLTEADSRGWIKAPVAGDGQQNKSICPKVPTWLPQGTIASGGGLGAGSFAGRECVYGDCDKGQLDRLYDTKRECAKNCIKGECSKDAKSGKFKCAGCQEFMYQCSCAYTDGTFSEEIVGEPLIPGNCEKLNKTGTSAVHFADIDGDGRDDYLYVSPTGKVTMFRNAGGAPDEGPNAGKVQWVGVGEIAAGVGGRGDQIRFADLDGDGRAEYLWVKDSGAVQAWWNNGFSSSKVNWGSATGEEIATGIGDGAGVVFADMNGDGRADFIHLAPNGAATLYINQGRSASGGVKWWNWGVIATGVGSKRENVRIVDLNGDGQADYVTVDEKTGGLNVWYNRGPSSGNWGTVQSLVWWNPGSPIASGVSQLSTWSDSSMVRFGDLNGDGRGEYLYVGSKDASIYAFLNGC